jgi:hypothetical protein
MLQALLLLLASVTKRLALSTFLLTTLWNCMWQWDDTEEGTWWPIIAFQNVLLQGKLEHRRRCNSHGRVHVSRLYSSCNLILVPPRGHSAIDIATECDRWPWLFGRVETKKCYFDVITKQWLKWLALFISHKGYENLKKLKSWGASHLRRNEIPAQHAEALPLTEQHARIHLEAVVEVLKAKGALWTSSYGHLPYISGRKFHAGEHAISF